MRFRCLPRLALLHGALQAGKRRGKLVARIGLKDSLRGARCAVPQFLCRLFDR